MRGCSPVEAGLVKLTNGIRTLPDLKDLVKGGDQSVNIDLAVADGAELARRMRQALPLAPDLPALTRR